MINIRQATKEDILLITQLAQNIWWPTYSPILSPEQITYMLHEIYAPEAILKTMETGEQTFVLLLDDGVAQGFASFGPLQDDTSMKLHKLYVNPETHGRGYGSALVDYIAKESVRQKKKTLLLNVNRHNPAKTFYQRLGFSIIREVDIPFGPYWMNDYVMALPLDMTNSVKGNY